MLSQMGQEGDGLQGLLVRSPREEREGYLAKPHFISQDPVDPILIQTDQPIHPQQLIFLHLTSRDQPWLFLGIRLEFNLLVRMNIDSF